MDDPLLGKACIAWSLVRAGYTSPGGKNMNPRHVRVMVIDNILIIGEGVMSEKRMRYRVEQHPTAERARTLALRHTANRERQDYHLLILPTIMHISKDGTTDWLFRLIGQKAQPAKGLHDSFSKLFKDGELLSKSLSPTVSPVS